MRAVICFVLLSCACAANDNLQRAKNAITVEEYRQKLLECKRQGKDAGSLAVYERCAGEVDREYGAESIPDGGKND